MGNVEKVKVIEIEHSNFNVVENIFKQLITLKKQNKINNFSTLVVPLFDLIIALSSNPKPKSRNNRIYDIFYKAIDGLELNKDMLTNMKERIEKELNENEYIILIGDNFINTAIIYIKSQDNNILNQII